MFIVTPLELQAIPNMTSSKKLQEKKNEGMLIFTGNHVCFLQCQFVYAVQKHHMHFSLIALHTIKRL